MDSAILVHDAPVAKKLVQLVRKATGHLFLRILTRIVTKTPRPNRTINLNKKFLIYLPEKLFL